MFHGFLIKQYWRVCPIRLHKHYVALKTVKGSSHFAIHWKLARLVQNALHICYVTVQMHIPYPSRLHSLTRRYEMIQSIQSLSVELEHIHFHHSTISKPLLMPNLQLLPFPGVPLYKFKHSKECIMWPLEERYHCTAAVYSFYGGVEYSPKYNSRRTLLLKLM